MHKGGMNINDYSQKHNLRVFFLVTTPNLWDPKKKHNITYLFVCNRCVKTFYSVGKSHECSYYSQRQTAKVQTTLRKNSLSRKQLLLAYTNYEIR